MARYDADVIEDFVPGKRTRKGRPLPADEVPRPRTVVAVPPSRARRFFRARSQAELRAHLRRLKEEGRLVTPAGKGLRCRVRIDGGRRPVREPWYVVEAPYAEAVPRCR